MKSLSWKEQSGFNRFKEFYLKELAKDDGELEVYLSASVREHMPWCNQDVDERQIDRQMEYCFDTANHYIEALPSVLQEAENFESFADAIVQCKRRKDDLGVPKSITLGLYHYWMDNDGI